MPARWRTESTSVQHLMVEACWRPMVGDVAGDFHDVVDLHDGRVALVIGDVAGVGIKAAEQADELLAELHRLFRRSDDPAEVLGLLDEHAGSGSGSGSDSGSDGELYATMACAVVRPASREIEVASAGHPPILLANGLEARLLEGALGPPLGIRAERRATTYPLVGDAALFLYTDGLVERRNASLADTLDELVRAGRGLHGAVASAAELARRVTSWLGQPSDDATVVSVRMLPSGTRRLGEPAAIGGRPRVALRVYVDARDLRSARSEAVVKQLAFSARETLDFLIEVLDVSEPEVDTEADGILAVPTIVRLSPGPVIRVVGSVHSVEELARALQLPLRQEDTWE